MIVVRTDEPQVFSALAHEYEASLPDELRHKEPLFTPELAFVAFAGEDPCGCVGWSVLDAATIVMRHLYVRPAFRNRGVARALLSAFTGAARKRGARTIVLDTDRIRLSAAYSLYLSLGFVECEPYGEVDYATPTFMRLELQRG